MNMEKNSPCRRVDVQFHSGYKGEEEPRTIIVDEKEWTVERILERKRISNSNTGRTHEEFICLVNKRLAKLSIHPDGQHRLFFLKD
jgi:hypothetical protein